MGKGAPWRSRDSWLLEVTVLLGSSLVFGNSPASRWTCQKLAGSFPFAPSQDSLGQNCERIPWGSWQKTSGWRVPPPPQRLTGSPHLLASLWLWVASSARQGESCCFMLSAPPPALVCLCKAKKNRSLPCSHVCWLLRPTCCVRASALWEGSGREVPGLTLGQEKPQRKRGHCLLPELSSVSMVTGLAPCCHLVLLRLSLCLIEIL